MLSWWGAVIGLLFASGVLLAVYYSPPLRPTKLDERIAPYLGELSMKSGSGTPGASSPASMWNGLRALVRVALRELATMIDTALGGSESVRRRLAGLGETITVEQFRVEQVLWGAGGGVLSGLGVGLIGWLGGALDPLSALLAAALGVLGGILARDYYLTVTLGRRSAAITAELPVIADLLALAVTAGEAPAAALERICNLTKGELSKEINGQLAAVKAGESLTRALSELADRSSIDVVRRFFEGVVVAIERGTPLAGVLRAQAADVHEMRKRALLAAGGRKEVAMMAPVVFLILPITVVFALFPGLSVLTSLTS
jgi:tight adherence protein C